MRNRSLFLLLACVCGTIAAIGVSQWMQAQSSSGKTVDTVEIFVTAKTIDVAEQITADKIRLEQWPADRVPKGATGNLEDLENKYARQRFYEGEPIMPVKLMEDASGSSQTIPVGYSVVSMKADPESTVATLLNPGDRVDVTAYFEKSELIPETTAKTVLVGVRVFAIDGRTERNVDDDKDRKPAKTISLLIHKSDTPAWTYAQELGKIRLTLGNPGDVLAKIEGEEGNSAGQSFLTWLADYQEAQAKRAQEEQNKADSLISRNTPAPVAKPEPEKKGFSMIKMSGGVLTEYWIEEGSNVPQIVNQTGGEDDKPREIQSNTEAAPAASTGYSYLNGSQSPFYQPPSSENSFPTEGDNPNMYDPLIADDE